jgi:hypothetical protein
MPNIVIGIDEGSYSIGVGTRQVTLSGITTFTPTIEALLYFFNSIQDIQYFAQADSYAKEVTITPSGDNYILEYEDLSTFPPLESGDKIHIQFWVEGADFINTNGYKGIVALAPGHVSLINSTTQTLGAGVSFTGGWELVTNFGVIVISVTSNVASATDGLMVEFSSDGTVAGIISDDDYTIEAGAKKTFSFQAAAQYYRVVYTNGSTIQSSFNLQTVLKPYYVKPSSHRIQDNIVDDDDAELNKSVLTGKSLLTEAFENCTTYRETLNVNNAWVNRKIINETYHRHNGNDTTLSVAASAGDTSITVVDATGFVTGEQIKLGEVTAGVGTQEIGIITLTNVVGSVLTLDRPIANDYTTSATVEEVTTNMAVSGTLVSPVIFEIDPPEGNVWQFTRILLSITDQTAMDDAKFGGITALTNGVALRATTEAGRVVVFANWKSNQDMKMDMYDVDYSTKAPSGFFGLNGRWTFTKAEVVAELDGDASPVQKLEVLIQDDLTGLDTFKMRGQGRVFSP